MSPFGWCRLRRPRASGQGPPTRPARHHRRSAWSWRLGRASEAPLPSRSAARAAVRFREGRGRAGRPCATVLRPRAGNGSEVAFLALMHVLHGASGSAAVAVPDAPGCPPGRLRGRRVRTRRAGAAGLTFPDPPRTAGPGIPGGRRRRKEGERGDGECMRGPDEMYPSVARPNGRVAAVLFGSSLPAARHAVIGNEGEKPMRQRRGAPGGAVVKCGTLPAGGPGGPAGTAARSAAQAAIDAVASGFSRVDRRRTPDAGTPPPKTPLPRPEEPGVEPVYEESPLPGIPREEPRGYPRSAPERGPPARGIDPHPPAVCAVGSRVSRQGPTAGGRQPHSEPHARPGPPPALRRP